MSYEGRNFYLCGKGHLIETDAWEILESHQCTMHGCTDPIILHTSVDDTNGEGVEPDLITISPRRVCQCVCGNTHTKELARYIPADPARWKSCDSPLREPGNSDDDPTVYVEA